MGSLQLPESIWGLFNSFGVQGISTPFKCGFYLISLEYGISSTPLEHIRSDQLRQNTGYLQLPHSIGFHQFLWSKWSLQLPWKGGPFKSVGVQGILNRLEYGLFSIPLENWVFSTPSEHMGSLQPVKVQNIINPLYICSMGLLQFSRSIRYFQLL